MTDKQINSHILRISGKVELLEEVEIGHNFKVAVSGSITSEELKDNQDGTFDKIYRFEPVLVELVNPLGKTIKSKDPRSKSKLLRSVIWREWKDSQSELGDEDFYNLLMNFIIRNLPSFVEKAVEEDYREN